MQSIHWILREQAASKISEWKIHVCAYTGMSEKIGPFIYQSRKIGSVIYFLSEKGGQSYTWQLWKRGRSARTSVLCHILEVTTPRPSGVHYTLNVGWRAESRDPDQNASHVQFELNLNLLLTWIYTDFSSMSFKIKRFNITTTRLYNFDPIKPHFYIVKLGFTGVNIIFLISAQKHRLLVLVRSTHNLCFEQKCEKISEFLSENFQFLEMKFSIHLNRRVFRNDIVLPFYLGTAQMRAPLKTANGWVHVYSTQLNI